MAPKPTKNPPFITFEGGEGAGKTTVISRIAELIQARNGQEIVFTREPGGVPSAESIRQVILGQQIDSLTETLLFAAARREHLVEKILPALSKGQPVFCDRFINSSVVYQGLVRGVGVNEVLEVNRFATEGLMPNLTIFLDVSPKVGLERVSARGDKDKNRFDSEELDFHQKVRDGFLDLQKQNSERIVRINSEQPLDSVVIAVVDLILAKFPDEFVLK